ncbi:hypothetical protein [Myxococcus sp. AB025B]|uniref:hypothetical protein n=1 Tax=Myxococcus sp. AB025B TaxID=2562794 RepID=UPI001144CEAD|nr:hypothetical protein [Myxococcus sp. AB025B]
MAHDVFITSLGKFLPGEPIPNDQMEDDLGKVRGKPSRARARVLAQNGITQRHYAIDREQRTVLCNWDLAVNAVQDALSRSPITLGEMDLLVTVTTQGDRVLPGFASQVRRALGGPAWEVASLHGICSSGMQALRVAALQVGGEEGRRLRQRAGEPAAQGAPRRGSDGGRRRTLRGMEEMRRSFSNDDLDAGLTVSFMLLLLATVAFGVRSALAARRSATPTANETPYVPVTEGP